MEAICAIDENNGLSKNKNIPWKSKKDMLFFMNKTKNNIVIMGKNTYFSIPEKYRPLKNILNIVLTNNPELYEYNNINNIIKQSNVLFTNNNSIYQDILKNKIKYREKYIFLQDEYKIFFIGSKMIYNQFIPLCDKIWITYIKKDYDCDLFINYDYSKKFKEKIYD